jgi:uncharacterized membrane protein YphA (DoxX/SURF4 family)
MRNKIIYWVATLWLCLGLVSTGVQQILKFKPKWDFVTHLGYPSYFLTILGIWKLLGVIALLLPKFPLLKEWAYAGIFFVLSGAMLSHIATDSINEMAPSLFLLLLTIVSWYFRPLDRKLVQVHPINIKK